jgi:hypothetical protein
MILVILLLSHKAEVEAEVEVEVQHQEDARGNLKQMQNPKNWESPSFRVYLPSYSERAIAIEVFSPFKSQTLPSS